MKRRSIPFRVHRSTPMVRRVELLVAAVLAGSVIASAGAIVPNGASRAYAASAAATWAPITSYPLPEGGYPGAVSCATATTCVVIDNFSSYYSGPSGPSGTTPAPPPARALVTTNSGTSWSSHPLPAGIGEVNELACPSTSECIATGDSGETCCAYDDTLVVSTLDGGTTWKLDTLPANIASLYTPRELSCASAAACVITADGLNTGATIVTTDGGATWTQTISSTVPDSPGGFVCSSATSCRGVGYASHSSNTRSILFTTNAGATWTPLSLPAGFGPAGELSCASQAFCVIGTGDSTTGLPALLTTVNGGGTFSTFEPADGITYIDNISCAAVGSCTALAPTAAGVLALSTTNAGASWTISPPLPFQPDRTYYSESSLFTCGAPGTCFALGSAYGVGPGGSSYGPESLFATTNGGGSWAPHTLPDPGTTFSALTCASVTLCLAVGNESAGGVVQVGSGSPLSWGSPTLIAPNATLNAVTCTTASYCVAAGNVMLVSTDGGTSWSPMNTPVPRPYVGRVACNAPGTCTVASYAGIYRTTDGGSTWTETTPYVDGAITGLSCPAGTANCYVAGYQGFNGPGPAGCCSGGPGFFILLTGATWVPEGPPGGNLTPRALTCPTVSTCDLVGDSGSRTSPWLVTTNGGSTWASVTLPAPPAPEPSLSVPPQPGLALGSLLTPEAVSDASCATSLSCTATVVVTYDQEFSNSTSNDAADNFASDAFGLATADGGATWSTITIPAAYSGGYQQDTSCARLWCARNRSPALGALTCPSSTTCLALSSDGTDDHIMTDSPFPQVSSLSPPSAPTAGGTAVTIDGSGFTGATAVHFGANAATGVHVVSESEITATSPVSAAPGKVDVTVTTPVGTSVDTPGDAFLYVASGRYFPITPYRVCDTRGVGVFLPVYACAFEDQNHSWPQYGLAAGSTLAISVAPSGTGAGSVPANASAVVVNVTAINPDGTGYLTVYPSGVPQPVASNINFVAHQTVASLAEVAVGANGVIDIANPTAADLDVAVDVEGYVAPSGGDTFTPLVPYRACDTRSGSASPCAGKTLGAGSTLPLTIAPSGSGTNSVPANASAVVLNVTAADGTTGGYLTVWPAGGTEPGTSNVNFPPRGVPAMNGSGATANRVIVAVGTGGVVNITNALGSTDVVVDVSGYFAASGGTTFSPMSPVRACDTRSGSGTPCAGKTLGAATTLALHLAGANGVPANASAVALVVTAADSTTIVSYFTLWPAGGTEPPTSDVNFTDQGAVANLVIVKVGTGGVVNLTNAWGSADAIVDVVGWYA